MDALLELILSVPTQPPVCSWLTAVVAFGLMMIQLIEYWRSRGRLVFHDFFAVQYVVEMSEKDVQEFNYMGTLQVGDPLEIFTVIEFTITNRHSRTMTIGRINIDGWMFEDGYRRQMYDRARDYRVYDIHTNEPTSLANYGALAPGQDAGFRVESYEHRGSYVGYQGDPNRFRMMRVRVPMRNPRKIRIEVHTSDGRRSYKIKLDQTTFDSSPELYGVYRLSGTELLPEDRSPIGQNAPQGVNYRLYNKTLSERLEDFRMELRWKIRDWF